MASHEPAGAGRQSALRTATLQLVLGVVALDAGALGIFYGAGIAHGAERSRTIFVALWTFATALTVAFLLRRVRKARWLARPPIRR